MVDYFYRLDYDDRLRGVTIDYVVASDVKELQLPVAKKTLVYFESLAPAEDATEVTEKAHAANRPTQLNCTDDSWDSWAKPIKKSINTSKRSPCHLESRGGYRGS